ncbi:type II secretion system minor pseudopilin GspI [Aliiglaciecola sp. CAU 1673]|uniref:type II secretion system minor pseudopilin GspI n=1 Tax=Aliiglaciecola sp. CAU 1673 TaxID=3032595 RepID=UPI0023DAA52F|nr:type II secretion system minor pseudopilin GspI [Aliiglaciecola sp. CAU 1673]MDF2179219.1 type II secretion system minor pseudopilin GspI [Aliiglaciecola sp. CAU 1673]
MKWPALQKGMTLLEVMVALLIFAITGTAIMKAASENLNNISSLEEVIFATWVANNRLTQIQLEGKWPPLNNQKGSQEMADRTWYWQQKVLETQDSGLRMVEVQIKSEENTDRVLTSVSTFIAKPGDRQ